MSARPSIEENRLSLQAALDGHKTQAERNRLGQFATPSPLALDILSYAKTIIPPREKIRFFDPAIGTGAFYSALMNVFPKNRVQQALGYEIDPHYGKPAAKLWKETGLCLKLGDFTTAEPSERYNLIICNPPYVRHHHLENGNKTRLQLRTAQASGMKISGLAGLYCHFLGLSHSWMDEKAVAGWLIPSEFMDVNYGQAIKRYLLNKVTLLHIHRFDPNDIQFADALVSSAVVWFRNTPPPKNHTVKFTFGGTLLSPNLSRTISAEALAQEAKWTRFPAADIRTQTGVPTISDLFKIKRGLATGNNEFFILTKEEITARKLPMELFTPILPSPRYLRENEITPDGHGHPKIDRARYLLDTKLPENEIKRQFPTLYRYLQQGKQNDINKGYLCQHRALWYAQENRPAAPIVCTYLGRSDAKSGKPFRFILNSSRATVANVYLAMYPTPLLLRALAQDKTLLRRIWNLLNEITPARMLGEGRVYGGGLHKLEPRELANVPVPEIAALLPKSDRPHKQTDLVHFAEHVQAV